ncbi:6-O-methylguanine DNA methyltransferase [Vagococcus elongatus]|uniref:6-O-methylguanine DNA methyltransferase n=2 Tax=Vagococcus elongatus TaxID=180344 RepID=A0A430B4K8_9ENTE|nr:6-O-methylguanine DNA methyltransferase [Vagococcus elongatus]
MAKYMKNKFPFCGVQSQERKSLSKALMKESRLLSVAEVVSLITDYYDRKEREYQYIAIDLAIANVRKMTMTEVKKLSGLVSEKTWWDSVDAWRKFFALWVEQNMDCFDEVFHLFYHSQDFWMRRVAINLQLMFRENTKTDYLEKSILKDLKTEEFFIQKAIGWSLRQYSKTNPEWVRQFISAHDLSNLAVREGSKYLS